MADAAKQDDILTVVEVAAILKCRPSSVYNLTRKRGLARYAHPLPVIRLPLGLRFKRSSILQWLDDIEEHPKRAS
jgi:predicted DNA-binding transcriptional regulator AlpA